MRTTAATIRKILVVALGVITTGAGLGGCGSATDDRPAAWSYISAAIVQPNCATANCHSRLSANSGVELQDPTVGYDDLVSRRFVVPGNSGDSDLMFLLRGQGNLRMPPDTTLPADDITLIARWIDAGAVDDITGAGANDGASP